MNVQMICDATCALLNIVTQWLGGTHGAFLIIWHRFLRWSCLYQELFLAERPPQWCQQCSCLHWELLCTSTSGAWYIFVVCSNAFLCLQFDIKTFMLHLRHGSLTYKIIHNNNVTSLQGDWMQIVDYQRSTVTLWLIDIPDLPTCFQSYLIFLRVHESCVNYKMYTKQRMLPSRHLFQGRSCIFSQSNTNPHHSRRLDCC